MSAEGLNCINCVSMDIIEEGHVFKDYEFAEDALDFEIQLAEARDVKFTQALVIPLSIGAHIVFTGTPCADLPWFSVNIGCGDTDSNRGDIAVHFNVRLPQCYVVRNTRRHEKWGEEETTAFRPFPFKISELCTIEVVVDEKETLWAVNGEHYCTYSHRNPSAFSAQWVQVTGIKDATINVQKTRIYPTLAPPLPQVPTRAFLNAPAQDTEPSWRRNLIATLSNGLAEGHQIIITGRLRPMLHSFAIDLMDNAQEWPRPNIHLHVNLRAHVDSQLDRQLVVLNAWLGAWGLERRQRTAKLVPGTSATFRIMRGTNDWYIFANDLLIGEFEFRASASGVNALRIRGDLYPEEIYICPSSDSPVE